MSVSKMVLITSAFKSCRNYHCMQVHKTPVCYKEMYKLQVAQSMVYRIYGIMSTNVWNIKMNMDMNKKIGNGI